MKYTCIKQHDITDCGAACLATVSRQYGFKTSITRIRQIAGTDKMGTNAYGMVKAAEQLGFTAKAVKGNQDAFFSEFPLPAVAHVVREGGLLHYVVIHKITKSKVVIADPAKGIIRISPEEFFNYAVEQTESGQVMDVEILVPLDRKIEVPQGYTLKDELLITNALKISHRGNPALLQNAANELNNYIVSNGLVPITTGYNVTVKEAKDPSEIDSMEVDIYVGISPNKL